MEEFKRKIKEARRSVGSFCTVKSGCYILGAITI